MEFEFTMRNLKLYDIVNDKDAYINGIIVGIRDDSFSVLWANDVLGIVTYGDEAVVPTGKSAANEIRRIFGRHDRLIARALNLLENRATTMVGR